MLNTLSIFEDLSRYLDPKASRKITEVLGQVYEEVVQPVTKTKFNEVREIVGDLGLEIEDRLIRRCLLTEKKGIASK